MTALKTYTDKQLSRLWDNVYRRMNQGYGGTWPNYGWDWPTLRVVKPGWYAALRAIREEVKDRQTSNPK